MAQLEDLIRGARVRGVIHQETVAIVDVRWSGADAIELTFTDAQGRPDNAVLYRFQERDLEVITTGRAWAFDADRDHRALRPLGGGARPLRAGIALRAPGIQSRRRP